MLELKKIIFNSLYTWITTHNSLFFSNILNLCFSFSFLFNRDFPIYLLCTRVAPLCAFLMRLNYL
jgi:hypothetical protein